MRSLRWAKWGGASVLLGALVGGLVGCGSDTPGRMEWVQPVTTAPRVGTVYCIRGWKGVFSPGIDSMAKQLNERGVTAYVYMPEQYAELAKTMQERYKGVARPEPICFIGHSRGVDSSIIIARKLEEVGVNVDLIIAMDSVDETTVPKNVRLCYNYWMPGIFFNTDLLRGIPLVQEPGSTGRLYNLNLNKDAPELREPQTNHINMDEEPKLQRVIIEHVLETCPERAKWLSQAPGTPSGTQR